MTIDNTDERLEKIKKLLGEKNGVIDDEIKNEIFEITTRKKQEQSRSVAKDLFKASNSYDSKEVIRSLGDIETPDIVKDQIRKTLSSILDPVRTTFMVEIPKYVDAISTEEKYIKNIPRAVLAGSMKKIEDGRFVSTVTGEDANKFMVNPEFKQLLSTGYKPLPDSKEYQDHIGNLSELSTIYGTPESDYIKNKDGNDIPDLQNKIEKVPATRNKTAGLFIETFDNILKNTNFINNDAFKEISLEGFLLQDKETKDLKSPSNTASPNWKISYKEKGEKYYLNINNNYEYYSSNVKTSNTSSYAFVGKLDNNFSDVAKQYIDGDLPECESYNNDELYKKIMSEDIANILELGQGTRSQFRNFLETKYPEIVQNFIQNFFSSYQKNRLLNPFKIPAIPGLNEEDINKATNLIILNLINFIPEVSQELIDCGKQPHPLNIDEVIELMSKKFTQTGNQIVPKIDPRDNVQLANKNPITEATSVATALLLIRLCVLENILKGLFVFDEHQYDINILDGELLVDFIFVKVLDSLENINILPQIEQIVEDNYDFFKTNGVIKDEDTNIDTNIESISINKVRVSNNSSELKTLIKALARKTLGYLKNLIGTESSDNSNNSTEMLSRITNNVIYDVVGDQTLKFNTKYNESRYSKRFASTELDNFFILEKYIDVGETFYKDNATTRTTQFQTIADKYGNIKGCINLNIYETFLKDFINTEIRTNTFPVSSGIGRLPLNILNNVMNTPKIGTRLVQVFSKEKYNNTEVEGRQISVSVIDKEASADEIEDFKDSLGVDRYNDNIQTKLKSFILNKNRDYDIKVEKIKQKKMYGFYNIHKNGFLYYYNSLLVCEKQITIPFSRLVGTVENSVNDLNQVYEENKLQMLNDIIQNPKYEILINKGLFIDKLPNLALIYSNCALSNSQMDNLFAGSKKRILDIYDASVNIKNYKYKNSTDKLGGISKKYQSDIMNIGNPNGGINFDVLQFFITTPILILKGLCQVMDPNISIASQIVNAAAAGLLFPKIDEDTNQISYPGESVILPTVLASLALLPVNIFAPILGALAIGPPVTPLPGMLFWALEPLLWKLPFFQNQASNSDAAKKLKNDPKNKGLNIGGADKFNCSTNQDE
jgi:hypothetical protein